MGDLAEKLLTKTAKEYAAILGLNGNPDDAANILRQQSLSSLLKGIKEFHDAIHSFDEAGQSEFISQLFTDGMHDEQVWQQQEVQMDAVKRYLHEQFTVTNLEQLPLRFVLNSKKTGGKLKGQTAAIETENMEDDEDDDDDDDNDQPVGEADSDESDPELSQIKKRLGNQDGFDDFDDSDNDLFNVAEEEWGEDEDKDEDEDENNFDFELPARKNKKGEAKTPKMNKRKTEVDDKFFKLADMEEFLDREDAKEEKKTKRGGEEESDGSDESETEDDGGQKLDMFASWSDEEIGKECMYSDFFDPPGEGDNTQQAMAIQSEGEESEENEGEESEENEEEEKESDEEDMETESHEDGPKGSKKKVHFSDSANTANKQGKEKQSLSSFEKRTEKLRRQIQALEEQSVAEKPWQLAGEVGARDRPENSMLEEHVDFKQAPPTAAEMTEERSKSIEEIILQRIKDKSFDDNQRQVRPVEEAFELKTERTLDQEKSKLSLHEVYEQEFLKLQTPEDEEKTNPVHDEIKKMMSDLFPRLDALASWHYTPLQAVPELRVKNNLPSIRMEEPTPITMSSAVAMAPEEIQARKKGELKGKTEQTKEDKHRERKKKKAAKREKMKEKEKRRKEVEKLNPGLGNKYSKERALKELEKEASGNIEVIKDKKSKTMSSKTFFSQLQEEVTSQTTTKAKKKLKQKSSDKLLL